MFLAVPMIILTTESNEVAFVSGSLVFAISVTAAMVTFPTTSLLGLAAPFSTPAAFFKSTDAGDVLRINVKLRSSYTVISTGMTAVKGEEVSGGGGHGHPRIDGSLTTHFDLPFWRFGHCIPYRMP